MFVTAKGTGRVVQRIVLISRGDNTSLRRRVSPLRERERQCERRGRQTGRKEGRNLRGERDLQEEGTKATRREEDSPSLD